MAGWIFEHGQPEGGQKREHADDGMALTRETLYLRRGLTFEQAQRRELGSNCAIEMVARFRIFGTAKERGKVGLTAAAALAVGVARVSIGSLCASSDFRSSEQAQA